ncbi:Gfo/Idh/MocA family protein [Alteromonas gilva]|uniref:Gfo/Idh/MocA family oxidoreductase n=1 Tax=Alteromonas gilva TaxID=2987522 RepID=A0ABT5KYU6_9ALTE|nr:Gfo/Idh/MocA family oxidoreductase [Alteromonas gilva]MDC8829817.1 Gfo/Idh/MocA family oxidoreductase [Alteromonas gilva]
MIGGGQGAFIGAVHRHAAGLDGHYELVCGAFSRDADNNQQTADELSIASERAYGSWQMLIEEESKLPADQRVQVLAIVTPNHLHVEVAKAALAAGIHVFCEKPLAISLDEAKSLQPVLASQPVLLGLAHTYIGYPMVWQARHMIENGELGDIRKVFVEYPQGWLSSALEKDNKQASWRTDPSKSGGSGCMGDIGTHALNMAEFVTGDKVTKLCADMHTHVEGRRLDDDGAALLRFAGGASGVLIASQVCAGEENGLKVRVYGEKGSIEWFQMRPDSLLVRSVDAPMVTLRAGQGMPGLCDEALSRCRIPGGHPEGYLEAMGNLYTSFAKAVRGGQTGKADGVPGLVDGLRGMAFIETMLSSTGSEAKWTDFVDCA